MFYYSLCSLSEPGPGWLQRLAHHQRGEGLPSAGDPSQHRPATQTRRPAGRLGHSQKAAGLRYDIGWKQWDHCQTQSAS